jgi:hypothetical protein
MLDTALTVFVASFVLGIVLLVVVYKERRRDRRFFAAGFRNWLDTEVDKIGNSILNNWEHFSKYIIQLNWYYSIHSVLKTVLKMIVTFYTYFENLFERNRSRTKQLRAEKRQLGEYNHLQQMTEHKEETALTPAQKKKLKQKKLDGK